MYFGLYKFIRQSNGTLNRLILVARALEEEASSRGSSFSSLSSDTRRRRRILRTTEGGDDDAGNNIATDVNASQIVSLIRSTNLVGFVIGSVFCFQKSFEQFQKKH